MYTFKTFFVLTIASYVVAAPPTDEPAECKPLKEKDEELSKCCNIDAVPDNERVAFKECIKLVKDKDDKKGQPKPEGYECMDDCVMDKLGFLTDKKIDAVKVSAAAKVSYTGDWAEPGAKIVEKCLAQAAANKDTNKCPTGTDIYLICIFRESFLICPEKLWTNSDACKANKERLNKCPKAVPYMGNFD